MAREGLEIECSVLKSRSDMEMVLRVPSETHMVVVTANVQTIHGSQKFQPIASDSLVFLNGAM